MKPDAKWANQYVGIPFLTHGRDHNGADCWGLVRLAFMEQKGIVLPSMIEAYRSTAQLRRIARRIQHEIDTSGEWIRVLQGQEQPFDVMVCLMQGFPMHVALVVKKGSMLHVTEDNNTVTIDYRHGEWKQPGKIIGIFRHKELCL